VDPHRAIAVALSIAAASVGAVSTAVLTVGCDRGFDDYDPLDGPPTSGNGSDDCGHTSALQHGFDGQSLDSGLFESRVEFDASMTVDQALVLGYSTQTASLARLSSRWRYNLRDSSLAVEALDMPGAEAATAADFELVGDGRGIRFRQTAGMLEAAQQQYGVWEVLASVPHDAAQQRWWRFSEGEGVTRWETSPDGQSWTMLADHPSERLFDLRWSTVRLVSQNEGGAPASAGVVRFDNLIGGPAASGWCPVSTLSDDFEDGARDARWSRTTAGTVGTAEDGRLLFTLPPNNDGADARYQTARAFDLRGDAIAIRLDSLTSSSGLMAELRLGHGDGNAVAIRVQDDELLLLQQLDGGGDDAVLRLPFDANVHRWWRIRDEAGRLSWETSSDGRAWTLQSSRAPSPAFVNAVDVQIAAATTTELDAVQVIAFDDLNREP
jgi:hypothetical protein